VGKGPVGKGPARSGPGDSSPLLFDVRGRIPAGAGRHSRTGSVTSVSRRGPPGRRGAGLPPAVAAHHRRVADFEDVRLHVVTGKGGTGKSTVAAAMALALASGGRQVLLTEVEGRQGIAQLFDTPPLPYEERKVAVAPGGGDVHALAIDPEEALLDYLHMFYKLSPTGIPARTLRRMGGIEFATTIAPGLRDVLLTGKVKEAVVRRSKDGTPAYDAVVLDAPPTGRIARFLNISHEVGGLAKVGPIKNQSEGVMAVLRSPATAVHLVTLLEEMPVQETLDGVRELEANRLPVGGVIVNAVREPRLEPAALVAAGGHDLDREDLSTALKATGIDPTGPLLDALVAEAADHATRVALEERGRDALAELHRPSYELPLLPDTVDLAGLYELAETLRDQGMA
jgi:Mrp family chromosome partitioning ATPase